jgi:hypothetical protein
MSGADRRLLTPDKKNTWETFKHRQSGYQSATRAFAALAAVSLSAWLGPLWVKSRLQRPNFQGPLFRNSGHSRRHFRAEQKISHARP